jgi:hypothetical protein
MGLNLSRIRALRWKGQSALLRGEYPTFLKATTLDGQFGLDMIANRGTAGNEMTPQVLYCADRLGNLADTRL